jgi:hypothetical protein
MASEAIDSLRRQRQVPAVEVERATPREIRLVAAEPGSPLAIDQELVLQGMPVGLESGPVATRSERDGSKSHPWPVPVSVA